ncbi:MAG TPA: hypothetical protein VJN94_13125 [Candidatus Binataceae bacterium]|nr:hypothetical protein [Candidatus Binataceae bacterium]
MNSDMRAHRGMREAVADLVELGPEVVDRMRLEAAPDAEIVSSFVMTAGAQSAWESINSNLRESHGELFSLVGPPGSGKTHFLNYIAALSQRAGSLTGESGRHLTFAIEASAQSGISEIDRTVAELLARELTGDPKAGPLWRDLGGAEALALGLDQSRRQGVKGVTIVIDLGDADAGAVSGYLRSLAELAASLKAPRLVVVVATRSEVSAGARTFAVAPTAGEMPIVAIGRVRRIDENAARMIDDSYRLVDCGEYEPTQIYPFHPATAAALAIARAGVAPAARIAYEALVAWLAVKSPRRLIYPAELLRGEQACAMAEACLGEAGRAALKAAYAAADASSEKQRAIARRIAETLMLHAIVDASPALGFDELRIRLPPGDEAGRAGSAVVAELLTELAAASHGVIAVDWQSRTARFNPRIAETREVAAYNRALPLLQRFDPSLTAALETPELKAKLKRLADAMAVVLEAAHRSRELLASGMREAGTALTPEQDQTFADLIAMAEGGADSLIERAEEPTRRDLALRTFGEYERLAAVAQAVPRLRAMREYLTAAGLSVGFDDDPRRERQLVALETECQLLLVALNPAVLSSASRNFDSLEARFQKFKWTYVQYYRAAHEQWRLEMERAGAICGDVRRYLDALGRLNSIAALGGAEGRELQDEMAELERRCRRCDLSGALAPEIAPCCAHCGYVLGTPSPREALEDLLTKVNRALQSKLATLSQSAISRLIREHDRSHRLEGFLKITQAAQTEALVRVLDDKLARYLGRLLDESPESGRKGAPEVPHLRVARLKRQGPRGAHQGKLPPSSRDR